jgi:hypothetical protein
MDDTPKDRAWLRTEVTELFDQAKGMAVRDHAICVKYAELLLKLMPPDPPGALAPPTERMSKLMQRYVDLGTSQGP